MEIVLVGEEEQHDNYQHKRIGECHVSVIENTEYWNSRERKECHVFAKI
jgi:tRNA(His) 5'-end guanylyltransferase